MGFGGVAAATEGLWKREATAVGAAGITVGGAGVGGLLDAIVCATRGTTAADIELNNVLAALSNAPRIDVLDGLVTALAVAALKLVPVAAAGVVGTEEAVGPGTTVHPLEPVCFTLALIVGTAEGDERAVGPL